MGRIRTIKPQFWTSEQILECSRNARLLFIGLWNFCDDAGRHRYSAKQVKAEVFPADDVTEAEVNEWLGELISVDLIRLYDIDGKQYFYVTGWSHQRIDKPQPARCPDPFADHSKNDPGTLPPDRIVKDKKGKEEVPAGAVLPGTLIKTEPLDFEKPVTEPPIPPLPEVPKEGQPGKYEFEGDVIRLTKSDYEKWARAFPRIDLRAELTARDAWLASAAAKDRERWFISTPSFLRNQNTKAAKAKDFKWASGIEGVY